MKVAVVSPGWPPSLLANGIASYVGHLHEGFQELAGELGVESRVLAGMVVGDLTEDDVVDLSNLSIRSSLAQKVRQLYERCAPREGKALWTSKVQEANSRAVISGMRRLSRRFQPDLLEMDESFGSARIVQDRLKIPVVVRLHGPYFITGVAMGASQDDAYDFRTNEERRTILEAPGITAPSLDLLQRVRAEYGVDLSHAEVIPNPVPTVSPDDQWRLSNMDRDLVLFVGRFDRHKGGDIMLRAFADAAMSRPTLRLAFIGPDQNYVTDEGKPLSVKSFIDEYVSDPGVRERIELLGQMSAQAIRPYRLKAAITVVASRYENFPMTVAEALAHGSPLIAPKTGGISEIVRHEENGLLFEPEDVDGLVRAIHRMLEAPESAAEWARRGAEDVRQRFSRSAVARQTAAYYERVANGWREEATLSGRL